jgi:putative ATP-dependent endonuclease of OLD family
MKLKEFEIDSYRSIKHAKLEVQGSSAVLIGPNNEGKSNVLHALNACLTALSSAEARRVTASESIRLRIPRGVYDWAVDFPIKRQASSQKGISKFRLSFQLSEKERADFERQTKSKLNGLLPIELRFASGPYVEFKVLKQGKGGKALSGKVSQICSFISRTLDFAYIPAVRSAETSLGVVNDLVRRELRLLEANQEYLELQKRVAELQKPVIKDLEDKLKNNLKSILGESFKSVSVELSEQYRYLGMRTNCQIVIDDGAQTLLERKGDGVQSLVAISLMLGILQDADSAKDIILLIEEPESHLHPNAIHQFRETLESLRKDNQVIITTHCPLLVNRVQVGSNIIVSGSQTTSAGSISAIRNILGVRASDNLQHAALVLVVEGPEDEVALSAILKNKSPALADAMRKGTMVFHPIGGASKLPYALALLQTFLCNYYCFLDDDNEGRKGYGEAEKDLLANSGNTTFTKCLGLAESEFEDLLAESVYFEYFKKRFSVDVSHAPFNEKRKWSARMRWGLTKAGVSSATGDVWPEKDEYDDKRAIAKIVAENPGAALNPTRESVIDALIQALENKLESISNVG